MLLLPLLLSLGLEPGPGISSSYSAGDELSQRLPAQVSGVLLLRDLEPVWKGGQEPGLTSIFRDERWLSFFAELGESKPEMEKQLEFLKHFRSVREAAVGVWVDDEEGPESGVGILRLEGSLLENLRQGSEAVGLEFHSQALPGWEEPAWQVTAEGETTPLLFAERDGLCYFAWPDLETSAARLTEIAGPLDEQPRWWLQVRDRHAQAQVEAFLALPNLQELTEDAPWLESIGPFYFSGEVAPRTRVSLRVDMEAPDYLPALADCLLPADTDLYRLAGSEHLSVSVLAMDVLRMAEFVVGVVEQDNENARAEYEAGLQAGGSFLGLDLEEDVLANLTGQFVMLQRPSSLDDLMTDELTEDSIPTFAFGHGDRDTFLLVIESLVGTLSNFALPVEFEEFADGELWTTSLDAMVPGLGDIGVAVDDGLVVLGPAADVRGVLTRSAGDLDGPPFAEGRLQGESRLGSGFLLGATDMTASWAMLEGFPSEVAPLFSGLADLEQVDLVQVVALSNELIAIARDHLGGVVITDFRVGASSIEIEWFGL